MGGERKEVTEKKIEYWERSKGGGVDFEGGGGFRRGEVDFEGGRWISKGGSAI